MKFKASTLEQPYIFVPFKFRVIASSGSLVVTLNSRKAYRNTYKRGALLPSGWHIRLKEHPNSQQQFERLYKEFCPANVIFDNITDTFEQVKAKRFSPLIHLLDWKQCSMKNQLLQWVLLFGLLEIWQRPVEL